MNREKVIANTQPGMNGDNEAVMQGALSGIERGEFNLTRDYFAELFCRGVSREDLVRYFEQKGCP